jgi:hypothetical protein
VDSRARPDINALIAREIYTALEGLDAAPAAVTPVHSADSHGTEYIACTRLLGR